MKIDKYIYIGEIKYYREIKRVYYLILWKKNGDPRYGYNILK